LHAEYRVDTVTGQLDRPIGIVTSGLIKQSAQNTSGVTRSLPRATANRAPHDFTGIARPVWLTTTTCPGIDEPARAVVWGRTILALRGSGKALFAQAARTTGRTIAKSDRRCGDVFAAT
jgi:hypothetical protein